MPPGKPHPCFEVLLSLELRHQGVCCPRIGANIEFFVFLEFNLGLLRQSQHLILSDHFKELHVEGLVQEFVVPVEAPHHPIEQLVKVDTTLGIHSNCHLHNFSMYHHFCVVVVVHALET